MFLINLKRLFVKADIIEKQSIILTKEQSHYLVNVIRLTNNDNLKIFNGKDGEWLAKIDLIKKNQTTITPIEKLKKQEFLPEVWLLFAPLKKTETDFIIQKTTELGATKIIPVITKRTNTSRINLERLEANAIEASEQCERLCVPQITNEINLNNIINDLANMKTTLFFLDERGNGCLQEAFTKNRSQTVAFLIGPEGGFDESERQMLLNQDFVTPITLGKRILRAETACLAVLSLWQGIKGDWLV